MKRCFKKNWKETLKELVSQKAPELLSFDSIPANKERRVVRLLISKTHHGYDQCQEIHKNLVLTVNDKKLFETSKTQWQFGDWDSLIKLDGTLLEKHPSREKLALFVAVAYLQLGDFEQAACSMAKSLDWGCNKLLIIQLLLSSGYNTLGCMAIIGGSTDEQVFRFIKTSVMLGSFGDSVLIAKARLQEQEKLLTHLTQSVEYCKIRKA